MGAGADPGIVMPAPIDEIVPRLRSRPRMVRDLIGGEARLLAELLRQDIHRACSVAVRHMQAARGMAGSLHVPDGDRASAMYVLTQELCEKAGLPAYEVSNHARPGSESRHNLIYWRGHDYAGIGAGAHARITENGIKRALATIKSPEDWLAQVEAQGHGLTSDDPLEPQDVAEEYLLMALRL